MRLIDFFMCAVSVIGGMGVLYLLIVSYLLTRQTYKDDAKFAKRAKELGFGG